MVFIKFSYRYQIHNWSKFHWFSRFPIRPVSFTSDLFLFCLLIKLNFTIKISQLPKIEIDPLVSKRKLINFFLWQSKKKSPLKSGPIAQTCSFVTFSLQLGRAMEYFITNNNWEEIARIHKTAMLLNAYTNFIAVC